MLLFVAIILFVTGATANAPLFTFPGMILLLGLMVWFAWFLMHPKKT